MKTSFEKRGSLKHIKGKVSEPTYNFLKTVNAVSKQFSDINLTRKELAIITFVAIVFPWVSTKNLLLPFEGALILRSITSFTILMISFSS